VNAWNTWYEDYDNDPEAIGSVLDRITEACADAGRDPDTLEKTAAFLLQFGDEPLRRNTHNPQRGTTSEMADALWRLSEAGIDHVQLVLDPITTGSIEAASGVLTALRG
jgi:alkanesulfonate monooxygenase SsuD/methylene tetrahydromethanopterin reductase-like flavin-dependent oxidoreductase (luciferase family)